MAHFYDPHVGHTNAYHKDLAGNEYFGKAPKGSTSASSTWQIMKMEYTGENWIMKFPLDVTTGKGSDAPKFSWDSVETHTYYMLGCTQ